MRPWWRNPLVHLGSAHHSCGHGGIGIRAGFRFQYRKVCGFESHCPHQLHVGSTRTGASIVKPAALLMACTGVGLVFATALVASLLVPYRTKIDPSLAAIVDVNVWGQALSKESCESLVARVNQSVSRSTLNGVVVEYHLKLMHVNRTGSIGTHFTMRVLGTSPEARRAVGDAIAEYFKRANRLLASRSLRIESGYVSDSPRVDKDAGTVVWEEPLWISIYRSR